MGHVDDLLAALARAAGQNEKAEFDRIERDLLSHFGGRLDAMPEEIYQRYLDVDRHWPIAVEPSADRPGARRTLLIRLGGEEEAWLQGLAVDTDRSVSAVIAECVDSVRDDPARTAEVRARLERGRRLPDEDSSC
jgi:predicted transcriptional regulator